MTALVWIAGACALWCGLCSAVLWVWSRRQEVPSVCAICDAEIEDIDPWRWAEHLGAPVHYACVPALIRACGPAYVTLWLDQGDALRTLSSAVETEEVAS